MSAKEEFYDGDYAYGTERISQIGKNYKGIGAPFFDYSNIYLPQNRRDLLLLAEYFYLTNSILRGTINKLAAYPLTDLQFDTVKDEIIRKKWDEILTKKVKVKDVMKTAGINCFLFGENYTIPYRPFVRKYRCSICGAIATSISKFKYPKWIVEKGKKSDEEDRKHTLSAECFHCKKKGEIVIKDDEKAGVGIYGDISFINVHPLYFQLKHNIYTGISVFFMEIDTYVKTSIRNFDADLFDTTQLEIIKASFDNKKIKINPRNVYHLKNVGVSSSILPGHGESPAVSTFKDLFFSQMLKHLQEIIAKDRGINYRGVSPSDQTSTITNLSNLKEHIENEIKEWRKDPNHVAWFPVPVEFSSFSGEAKNLFLSQEIMASNNNAIVGLEVPQNFVYGNVGNYSGGSVDLRMLENRFISYVTQMNEMLQNFIIPKCAAFYQLQTGGGEDRIRFQKFKMADDVQQKELMVRLNAAGKISNDKTLQTVDANFTWAEESEQIKKEALDMAIISGESTAKATELQTKATIADQILQMAAQEQFQSSGKIDKSMFEKEIYSRLPIVENAAATFYKIIMQNPSAAGPFIMQWEQLYPHVMERLFTLHPDVEAMVNQLKAAMMPPLQLQSGSGEKPKGQGGDQGGNQFGIGAGTPPNPEQKPPRREGGQAM